MNKMTLIPALVVGLCLSSAAMAKSKSSGTKRTRLAKAEKQMHKVKGKRSQPKSEIQ